jgi:hypothetical protein
MDSAVLRAESEAIREADHRAAAPGVVALVLRCEPLTGTEPGSSSANVVDGRGGGWQPSGCGRSAIDGPDVLPPAATAGAERAIRSRMHSFFPRRSSGGSCGGMQRDRSYRYGCSRGGSGDT